MQHRARRIAVTAFAMSVNFAAGYKNNSIRRYFFRPLHYCFRMHLNRIDILQQLYMASLSHSHIIRPDVIRVGIFYIYAVSAYTSRFTPSRLQRIHSCGNRRYGLHAAVSAPHGYIHRFCPVKQCTYIRRRDLSVYACT